MFIKKYYTAEGDKHLWGKQIGIVLIVGFNVYDMLRIIPVL